MQYGAWPTSSAYSQKALYFRDSSLLSLEVFNMAAGYLFLTVEKVGVP